MFDRPVRSTYAMATFALKPGVEMLATISGQSRREPRMPHDITLDVRETHRLSQHGTDTIFAKLVNRYGFSEARLM